MHTCRREQLQLMPKLAYGADHRAGLGLPVCKRCAQVQVHNSCCSPQSWLRHLGGHLLCWQIDLPAAIRHAIQAQVICR